MADAPKSLATVGTTRPADAENAPKQNAKVLKRAIKTAPPTPLEAACETKDRVLP